MTSTYAMPVRKWADDEPQEAPQPVVLVSSRDGHPVPPVGVLERNPALARAGNGVMPLQAATAIRLLLESH